MTTSFFSFFVLILGYEYFKNIYKVYSFSYKKLEKKESWLFDNRLSIVLVFFCIHICLKLYCIFYNISFICFRYFLNIFCIVWAEEIEFLNSGAAYLYSGMNKAFKDVEHLFRSHSPYIIQKQILKLFEFRSKNIYSFWNCNFPMNPLCPSVGRLVCRFFF